MTLPFLLLWVFLYVAKEEGGPPLLLGGPLLFLLPLLLHLRGPHLYRVCRLCHRHQDDVGSLFYRGPLLPWGAPHPKVLLPYQQEMPYYPLYKAPYTLHA